jgi:hypothetical protein
MDLLSVGRSRDRIPMGRAKFSPPVQTGPGAHPTSCTMVTGSFPEVKRSGRGVDHSPQSRANVKERVELYLYSHFGRSWPVIRWTLPVTFTPATIYLKHKNNHIVAACFGAISGFFRELYIQPFKAYCTVPKVYWRLRLPDFMTVGTCRQ